MLSILKLLCAFLFVYQVLSASDDPYYRTVGGRFSHEHSHWMKIVSNSVRLNDLSLPGTHDTGALYGGDLAETQSTTTYEQLKAGIRVLDLRLRHIGNGFTIHHGVVYMKQNFDGILQMCNDFLDTYPSEVIMMFLAKEHTEEGNTRTFQETYQAYVKGHNGRKIWSGRHIPTLGEVRGRIVIFDDMPGEKTRGIDRTTFVEQNWWNVPSVFRINDKWDKVKAHFDIAKPKNTFYVNWLSGSSDGAYPYTIASIINVKTGSYLDNYSHNGIRRMVLMMDFPGPELIHKIIVYNPGFGGKWPLVCEHH